MESFNGKPIWFSPGAIRIVYSDASDPAMGDRWGIDGGAGPNGCSWPLVRSGSIA